MRETLKKWIVQNDEGKDIFFFELYYLDDKKDAIYFDTSLSKDMRGVYMKSNKLYELLVELLNLELSHDKREELAQTFFGLIKKNKVYKKWYFAEECLGKDGRLLEANYQYYLQKINPEREINTEHLEPYSDTRNEIIFEKIKQRFYTDRKEIMQVAKEITKEDFEKELKNNLLDHAYVDIHSPKNKFYAHEDAIECSYFIIKGNKLQLVFDRKKVVR